MSIKRVAGLVAVVMAAWLLASRPAFAQCAMCKAAIANSDNPAEAARTINTAILVLFIPTMVIIGAIIGLVLKYRHPQSSAAERGAPDTDLRKQPWTTLRGRKLGPQPGSRRVRGRLSNRVTGPS